MVVNALVDDDLMLVEVVVHLVMAEEVLLGGNWILVGVGVQQVVEWVLIAVAMYSQYKALVALGVVLEIAFGVCNMALVELVVVAVRNLFFPMMALPALVVVVEIVFVFRNMVLVAMSLVVEAVRYLTVNQVAMAALLKVLETVICIHYMVQEALVVVPV